jgi:hypothetical protein
VLARRSAETLLRFTNALAEFVVPGLVPGIHVLAASNKDDVDGRDRPGHDGS